MTSQRSSIPVRRLGFAALFFMTATAHVAWAGNQPLGPNETVCPNPTLSDVVDSSAESALAGELTGIPIKPGATVLTQGTNTKESPELTDEVLRTYTQPFKLQNSDGSMTTGLVVQQIKRGKDKHCKCEWTVRVDDDSRGCISTLRINDFYHPLDLPIVADFRDDLGSRIDIPSRQATRSQEPGSKFRFQLPKICAKQVSRPLLLNTSIDVMVPKGTVQVQGLKGELSERITTWVPKR